MQLPVGTLTDLVDAQIEQRVDAGESREDVIADLADGQLEGRIRRALARQPLPWMPIVDAGKRPTAYEIDGTTYTPAEAAELLGIADAA